MFLHAIKIIVSRGMIRVIMQLEVIPDVVKEAMAVFR